MISYADAIAECAEHIAEHDAHGYSQPNREGHDVESLAFSDGTPYAIHLGDYDCSEMVRTCVAAAGLVAWGYWDSYMWTGNEDAVLTGAGFVQVPLDQMRRGDVLWKPGHTGVYLGDGLMADAHGDEYGCIDGPHEGDQTGREIEIRSVWSCSWQRCYRPPEGCVGGAPELSIENGIDISNWQSNMRGDETSAGFVIVKVSEDTDFVDAYAERFLESATAAGKLVGMYHFARRGDAIEQAEHFVTCARNTGYLEGSTLWLDYEADAIDNGPAWAERFMEHVDALTGKTCGIYMSQSIAVTQEWAASAHRPLWVAQYATDDPTYGWQDQPWSTGVYGAWGGSCAIHQYSGNGFVDGCGPLDLDRGYFTREQWAAWAGGEAPQPEPTPAPEPQPEPQPEPRKDYEMIDPRTLYFATNVNVRTAPSLGAEIVAVYHVGEEVTVDGIAIAEGYTWGHYIGGESGADRWVALGPTEYVVEAH